MSDGPEMRADMTQSPRSREYWEELLAAGDEEFVRDLKALRDRAREERQRQGLTQSAIAARLDVPQSRISDLETGDLAKTSLKTLRRYLRVLGFHLQVNAEPAG